MRLEEQIKLLERKNNSDQNLANEKVMAFEKHIARLEEENIKLSNALKSSKQGISRFQDQTAVAPNVIKQLKEKDQVIVELTGKLRESIKSIHEAKKAAA